MKLFVDSRDLISIFNEQRPLPIGDLADRFAKYGHQLVMPFSVISELIPSDDNRIVVLRRFTKLEEDFSLSFLQQHHLPDLEIRKAAEEFFAGIAPTPHDPYVSSFHALWGDQFKNDPIFLMDIDRTVGMRKMSTQIELTLERSEIYHWREKQAARAVAILQNEQKAIVQDNRKTVFRNTLERWLRRVGVQTPATLIAGFSNMLRRNPRVAPGWRLFMEVFDQLVRDKEYKPTVNDVWDLAHVTIVPYVDAATLDKNKVELVKRATRRLQVFDQTIDYDKRVFSRIDDLLLSHAP